MVKVINFKKYVESKLGTSELIDENPEVLLWTLEEVKKYETEYREEYRDGRDDYSVTCAGCYKPWEDTEEIFSLYSSEDKTRLFFHAECVIYYQIIHGKELDLTTDEEPTPLEEQRVCCICERLFEPGERKYTDDHGAFCFECGSKMPSSHGIYRVGANGEKIRIEVDFE